MSFILANVIIILANVIIILANRIIVLAKGIIILAKRKIMLAKGIIILANGSFILANGSFILANGSFIVGKKKYKWEFRVLMKLLRKCKYQGLPYITFVICGRNLFTEIWWFGDNKIHLSVDTSRCKLNYDVGNFNLL